MEPLMTSRFLQDSAVTQTVLGGQQQTIAYVF